MMARTTSNQRLAALMALFVVAVLSPVAAAKCPDLCQKCNGNRCTQCQAGAVLDGTKCRRCPKDCLMCDDDQKCTLCNLDYGIHPVTGKCEECDKNCWDCIITETGRAPCNLCLAPWIPDSNGKCRCPKPYVILPDGQCKNPPKKKPNKGKGKGKNRRSRA